MTVADIPRTIDAVWRIESPRLIAGIARMVGDVGTAEDLAQDALLAALDNWPTSGVPDNPGAWLMTTARNRAIDLLRRNKRLMESQGAVSYEIEMQHQGGAVDVDAALDDDLGDDLLRLIFTACHPVLSADARAALTLRLVGGLTTEEVARAFLVPLPTMAARITRAKKALADARVGFEAPGAAERTARLASVLEVIYLIFNEGYAATAGEDWMRPALCEDALRVGRVLSGVAPDDAEIHGLVALMEIQASRTQARTAADGTAILLLDQDRGRWDRLQIGRGLAALARAEALGGSDGFYALQAAIAACHARAGAADDTDWTRIATLYDQLAMVITSPVVELNRAVAHGMAFGPEAGLRLLDHAPGMAALSHYHFLPSVRGDLLYRLQRFAEARSEFTRAASLTTNARQRELLLARVADCER